MATETLRPNSAGDECNINSEVGQACPNHYLNVDDIVHDEGTTCVYAEESEAYLRDLYNLGDFDAGIAIGNGVISSVTVHAVCRGNSEGDNYAKISIKSGVTSENGDIETLDTVWTDYSKSWITDPDTSAPWTWTAIDALQAGISLNGNGAFKAAYCTQVYVVIAYNTTNENIVRIAFDSDPLDDVSVWTDVSDDLISFYTKRGRQHQLDRNEAGTATILLKNLHGNYWPNNDGGIYYPEVKLGKRINLKVKYEATYDEYTGFIRRWTPFWFSQSGNLYPGVRIECTDLQRNLAKAKLNHAGYDQEKSGVRIGNVLTTVGWPVADRDIDTGKENVIATDALVNVNSMEHIFKVQESELGLFFIRGDGYAVYHERGALEALESQTTFGTGNLPIFDPVFPLDDELLYNEVRLTREGGVEQVYSDAASILAHSLRTLARSGLLLTNDTIVYVYCLYLVARYHDVKMRIKSFTVKPQTPGHEAVLWPLVLGLEIGQKITLVWTEASISGDYFIEGIEHSWDYREGVWITKYQCSDADQFYFEPDAVDETLYPNAGGDETNIPGLVGKPTHWEAVADSSTGTYVWHSSDGFARDLYNCESLVVENVVISKITVHALCLQEDYTGGTNGWAKVSCKSGDTVSEGDQESPDIGTWTDISKEWTTNPDTSVAWTYDDIAALQIGVSMKGGGLGDFWIRCMRMWVVVDYIPAW